MTFRSASSRSHHRATRPNPLFKWAKSLVFVAALIAATWLGFHRLFQNKFPVAMEEALVEAVGKLGLEAELGTARFLEGKGIQLNQVSVGLPSNADNRLASNLQIYEAFVHTHSSSVKLATQKRVDAGALELRRAKLTLVRQANGQWDFEPILALMNRDTTSNQEPSLPVFVYDSEIQILDLASPSKRPLRFVDLNLTFQKIYHENRPLLRVQGKGRGESVSGFEWTVHLDQENQAWHVDLAVDQVRLGRDLANLLPQEIRRQLDPVRLLHGKVSFSAQVTGSTEMDSIPKFHASGNVDSFAVNDPRLPFFIDQTSGQFEIDNQGFSVRECRGKIDDGSFHFDYGQSGLFTRSTWQFRGWVRDLDFSDDPRLLAWLPSYCGKFCNDFAPSGLSDVQFDLRHDGKTLHRAIRGDLKKMSFTFAKFPYKTDNCSGIATLNGREMNFDVQSLTSGQLINLKGQVQGVGADPTFEITVTVPGKLPIDQKLETAFEAQPKIAKIAKAFNATGYVAGQAKFERRVPRGKVHKSIDARLKQCAVRHDGFDYPIHNVEGLIQVRDEQFNFVEVNGNNNSGKIACSGKWDPVNGLDLRFLCNSVLLDDELKFALKPNLRDIWEGFRPRGTVDFLRVDMRLPIGQKELDLDVGATLLPNQKLDGNYVSIHPTWFPYELEHVTGKFEIGNGLIKLNEVRGRHQETWLVCKGDGRYTAENWSVRLTDLLVGSLKIDDDLIKALPGRLGSPVRQLRYEGLLNVAGEFTVAGRQATHGLVESPSPNDGAFPVRQVGFNRLVHQPTTSMAWDLRFDMNQAKMLVGVPLENVFGMIKLTGQYDGKSTSSQGVMNIDSMTVRGAQVSEIKGPIWIDENRAGVGIFANPSMENASPILPKQAKSLTGQLQQGIVNFDAQTTFGQQGKFYFQGTLENGCLATACRELAPNMKDVEGHSFVALRMHGDFSGTHSYRGDGTIQLRNAKIYELPVFLSLLKILKIRQANRTAFDASNIDFQIEGEDFDFNRMEFLGDAVSLIGNGRMNLDRDIDLNFYSIMGRNRFNIPLLSDLYRLGSQKILWINVNGTLDNPQTNRHVLPELNDSLKQLFQPRNESRRPNWYNFHYPNQY